MAVDSATSYATYMEQAEKDFLEAGWALDDEEAKVLHESRKGTYSYMVKWWTIMGYQEIWHWRKKLYQNL